MRILTFLFLAVMLFAAAPVKAQEKLSKEEKKELNALLKKYKKDPQALMELQGSVDMYRDENSQLQAQINSLSTEKQMLDTKVQQLEQNNIALNNQLATTQDAMNQMAEKPVTLEPRGDDMVMGTTFRVQIGAYEKNYIPENLESTDGSMTLEMADGLQKVMVGQFRDYQEAKALMKHMKKIGLRDAWVVAYVDGGRVDLNDVVSKDKQ